MIISYFKFVFLRFTSSFYLIILISFQLFTFKLCNFTDYNAFFPAMYWQIFTNWSQSKVEDIVGGSIELCLLRSFLINSFKALFFKKLCQFKLISINDILFQSDSLHFVTFIIMWESWWKRIAWQPWGQCGTIRKQDQLEKAALKTR